MEIELKNEKLEIFTGYDHYRLNLDDIYSHKYLSNINFPNWTSCVNDLINSYIDNENGEIEFIMNEYAKKYESEKEMGM